MTEAEIIKKITSTIDNSIEKFNKNIPKVQRDILNEVELLVKKLDLKADTIQASTKNIRVIAEIQGKINRILQSPEYRAMVREYLIAFKEVSKLQNEYFKLIKADFTGPKLLAEIQVQSIQSTLNSLFEAGITTNIGSRIVDILRLNITTGAKYTDMVERLREYLMTTKAGDGALERYAKQITTDALNQYAAQNLNVISNDLGFEWFRYTGSEIESTRPFCIACLDKEFIHISEFTKLIEGNFPEFKKAGGKIDSKTDLPSGMIAGTNVETLSVYRGGWNCRHQMVPVSEGRVPANIKALIQ